MQKSFQHLEISSKTAFFRDFIEAFNTFTVIKSQTHRKVINTIKKNNSKKVWGIVGNFVTLNPKLL